MNKITQKQKGFLFTISVILFASTLVFFVQTSLSFNETNERTIILAAKPLSTAMLNDNISFSIGRILKHNFDINGGAISDITITGQINHPSDLNQALQSLKNAIDQNLLPLLFGSTTIDFSNITDGNAEAIFGKEAEFDYDYSSPKITIHPTASATLSKIDLNLFVQNDLNRIEWSAGPESGTTTLQINYYDDSNYFNTTTQVNPSLASTLVLFYDDGNITLSFGSVEGVNSSVRIQPTITQKIDYKMKTFYSSADVFPARWNAKIRTTYPGFDSNAYFVIAK
ncbi:MAG: hypothetical protein NTY48_01260 [Candidatus Diapherotrites archaeon]|nr:hypothetical protein [Candidatus Diapherotrites archaeon]